MSALGLEDFILLPDSDEVTIRRSCRHLVCPKKVRFGFEKGFPTHCTEHRLAGQFDVVSKRCLSVGCNKFPSFGFKGSRSTHCGSHKLEGHINLSARICSMEGCNKTAKYGFEGGSVSHCPRHQLEGQVNIVSKRCSFSGCRKQPVFGLEGQKPTRCSEHRLEGFIDIVNRRCLAQNCGKVPVFGHEGSKPLYCSIHRNPEHIDLVSACCKASGCRKSPSYGPMGGKMIFCAEHKSVDHVTLKGKSCVFPDCRTIASFGLRDGRKEYCSKHKLDEHINLTTKQCNVTGCDKIATRNVPGSRPVRCKKHSLFSFVASPSSKCKVRDCNNLALYGTYKPYKKIYCQIHLPKEDLSLVNLVEKPCRGCKVELILNIQGYCQFCESISEDRKLEIHPWITDADISTESPFYSKESAREALIRRVTAEREKLSALGIILEEDDECILRSDSNVEGSSSSLPIVKRRSPNHLVKQRIVEEYLIRKGYMPIVDRTIDRGECGKERPDFLLHYGTHDVIIEVDEFQHRRNRCDCEQIRMVNIFNSNHGTPIWFIRYNPDVYRRGDDEKPAQHQSDRLRLKELKRYIEQYKNVNPISLGAMVWVTYLFYDGHEQGERGSVLIPLNSDS